MQADMECLNKEKPMIFVICWCNHQNRITKKAFELQLKSFFVIQML